MNKFSSKSSKLKQQAKTLADKQKNQDQINQMVDAAIGDFNARLQNIEQLVAGLCDVVGMEDIIAAVNTRKRAEGEARVAAETAQLTGGIEAGYVIPISEVDDKTYVVGLEHDKNGTLCEYGPQQEHYKRLDPEYQALLLGKKVGDTVTTSRGNTFQVTGVYHIDNEKAKAYFEAQAKQRAEEQAKKAEAAKIVAEEAARKAQETDGSGPKVEAEEVPPAEAPATEVSGS